jgi:hypothetical protein
VPCLAVLATASSGWARTSWPWGALLKLSVLVMPMSCPLFFCILMSVQAISRLGVLGTWIILSNACAQP